MMEFRSVQGSLIEAEAARHRARETRMRRALQRILTAAEGVPGYAPMNWADVADVAREALEAERATGTDRSEPTTQWQASPTLLSGTR